MRLPKTVRINGKEFAVRCNHKSVASHFHFEERDISIGTFHQDRKFGNFLHEVAEISCIERGIRHVCDREKGGNADFLFCGNHSQFTDMLQDVATVIEPMIKE